jgi:hypothetical protein
LGAKNDIAPFDDAAFGRKVGELIARGASARKARKKPWTKSAELISLRKRES